MNILIHPVSTGSKWSLPYFLNTARKRQGIKMRLCGYWVQVVFRHPTAFSHSCEPIIKVITRSGKQQQLGKPFCQNGGWHRGHH